MDTCFNGTLAFADCERSEARRWTDYYILTEVVAPSPNVAALGHSRDGRGSRGASKTSSKTLVVMC
jgi:hypothetical protein